MGRKIMNVKFFQMISSETCFFNQFQTLGTCKDDIHLIGHGVGAHIAGYVGQEINGLKKITGLDPTGPRFEYMPEIVRLHAGCAKYVEVLHTDYFQSW